MRTSRRRLQLHLAFIGFLSVLLCFAFGLNSLFLTPFTSPIGDHKTPYMSDDHLFSRPLEDYFSAHEYQFSGPFGAPVQTRHDRYIQARSWNTRALTWIFLRRKELAFGAGALGVLVVVASRFYLKDASTGLTRLVNIVFVLFAAYITLLTRWDGYG